MCKCVACIHKEHLPWCLHMLNLPPTDVPSIVCVSVCACRDEETSRQEKGHVCPMSTGLKYSLCLVSIDRPSQTNVSWPSLLNCLLSREVTHTGGSQGCRTEPKCIHALTDLWCLVGTALRCELSAKGEEKVKVSDCSLMNGYYLLRNKESCSTIWLCFFITLVAQ